jgi:hypothetical protein
MVELGTTTPETEQAERKLREGKQITISVNLGSQYGPATKSFTEQLLCDVNFTLESQFDQLMKRIQRAIKEFKSQLGSETLEEMLQKNKAE